MKIVLDTNVLVSGLLRPRGMPARIVRLVLSGQVEAALDARIFDEYRDVTARPRLKIEAADVAPIFEYLRTRGEWILDAPALANPLPDPEDAMFLEVARAAHADALVTGNVRHFPPNLRAGVRVATPREFLALWAGLWAGETGARRVSDRPT